MNLPNNRLSKEDMNRVAAQRLENLLSLARERGQTLKHGRLEEYLNKLSSKFKMRWLKTYVGAASPARAIDAKCCDCVGYSETEQTIRECKSYICPLWHHRPYQSSSE